MSRPGANPLQNRQGISPGVGIVTVLAVGLAAVSVLYFLARQEVYAETAAIDFSRLPKSNQNLNAPINAD